MGDPDSVAMAPSGSASEVVRTPLPPLEEVLRLAREQAPDLVRARGASSVAEAGYAGARLAPIDNPYLETFVDRGNNGATRDVMVQSNLWLPVEASGQRAARIDEVDALVGWQRTLASSTEFSVLGATVRAYGAAIVASVRVRTLDGLAAGARAEADYHAQRFAVGDATAQDRSLADLELARIEVLLREGRSELSRCLLDLAQTTGRTFAVPDVESPLPPPPSRHWGEQDATRAVVASPHIDALRREADYHGKASVRAAREAHVPVNLILSAGRGDLGETRLGGGLAWTFPVLRRNQSEVARATAERTRALTEADARGRVMVQSILGLERQREDLRGAREHLDAVAAPAAEAAVAAAVAMRQAGKGEALLVLTARRDLALLKLRRLELAAREWSVVGDLVSLTGAMP